MTQKTITEKEQYLQRFETECQTTLKLLKSLPETKSEYRPNDKLRTARELAWVFITEQGLADHALAGKLDFSKRLPDAPSSYAEVIKAFEKNYRDTLDKVTKADEATLHRTVAFPTGPGKMGDMRVQDILWFALMDQIHHRGQFSIYLRMTGSKVPSIYGPTADEPWM
ncbi:MAG TPA: DinB family protein [Candidatus Udaeobacter sp.]|jgi:uncharacterized damage-inducible protein DinB|nr:DinB family protein [Candidatus Udaeobacter sp.]